MCERRAADSVEPSGGSAAIVTSAVPRRHTVLADRHAQGGPSGGRPSAQLALLRRSRSVSGEDGVGAPPMDPASVYQTRRCGRPLGGGPPRGRSASRYLVDPASSHMLVSKIKPCMSKYKPLQGETANGSLNQLWFLRSYNPTWITVVILELIHATKLRPLRGRALLLDQNQCRALRAGSTLVTLDNFVLIARPRAGDVSFKCLPYQLSMVRDMPTMVLTGNGESGFDSGEGA